MARNIVLLTFFLYFFALLQASFLAHFDIAGVTPNPILILIILVCLIEKPSGKMGIFSALWGGFLLDIYSGNFIGFYMAILLFLTFILKVVFPKYVKLTFLQNA